MLLKNKSIKEGTLEARATLWNSLSRISEHWNLNAAEMARILQKDRSRLAEWKKAGAIPEKMPRQTKELVQNVLATYRSLGAIFQNHHDQIKWLNTPHPDLGNVAPLQMMTSMKGLFEVRAYLDYVRGRGA